MNLPKILIIEDEASIKKELEWLVGRKQAFHLLGSAGSVKEAVEKIVELNPDLVLMDIQLPDGNAFEILNKVADRTFSVIFITAFDHFAIKAIKYGAMDYLLKPVDEVELYNVLENYNERKPIPISEQLEIVNEHQKYIEKADAKMCVSTQESLEFFKIEDILYLAGDGSYTHFHLRNGNKIISSKPLKFYEDLLPQDNFLKCHQSYIVNTSSIIRYLKAGFLVLDNNAEIPVATRRREAVVRVLSQL